MKVLQNIIITIMLLAFPFSSIAKGNRYMNDKLLNRPYADLRAWHLGFSVGLHTQNLLFTHNGYVTEDGESWFMEQPDYSPGFCVNGLVDFRLSTYFSIRFSPGLYFGNKKIEMLESKTGATDQQNIKSTYVVLPFDLKYYALRQRNFRPYMLAGIMPAFDVTKKHADYLRLKSNDFYLSIGFGTDFYLPYFKFIPEIKFCFGLSNILEKNRPDLVDDPTRLKFTQSLNKATSRMIVMTFYFE